MTGPGPDERPDLDALYELLSSQRRRRVLRVLHDGPVEMGVDQLAEQIARTEIVGEEPATAEEPPLPRRTVERVTAGLAHVDLPKLDNAGLVRYDRSERTVAATEDVETLVPLLDPFDDD